MWLPWTRNKASCTQSYQILQSQRAKQSAFSLRSTSRQKLSICEFTTWQKARSNIRRIPKLFSGFLHSTSPNKSSENDFLLPGVTVTKSSWYFFCNPLSAHFFLTFYKHDNSSEPIKCSEGWGSLYVCPPGDCMVRDFEMTQRSQPQLLCYTWSRRCWWDVCTFSFCILVYCPFQTFVVFKTYTDRWRVSKRLSVHEHHEFLGDVRDSLAVLQVGWGWLCLAEHCQEWMSSPSPDNASNISWP